MVVEPRRSLPLVLREGTLAHRRYVGWAWTIAALVLAYPVLAAQLGLSFGSIDQPARIGQLNAAIAFAVAILGLDVVIGWSGQLALGQSAFVGIGAYSTVILVADHHWSFYVALPATALISFAAGLVVGVPATRVKGVYLAIVTLVLAACFPSLVLRMDWLTGGANGKGTPRTQGRMEPPSWLSLSDEPRLARPLWIYCISLTVAVALFVLVRNFVRSRPGRAMITMRDHEPAAVALGVHVAWFKAMAFGASAGLGGIAGWLLMLNRPFVTDQMFGYRMSIFLVAGLVIGGLGTITGAIPGALAYVFVPWFLTEWAFDQRGLPAAARVVTRPVFAVLRPAGGDAGAIFFGAALIVLTFVLPGGFVAGIRRLRAHLVTVVAHPAWLNGRESLQPFVQAGTEIADETVWRDEQPVVDDDTRRGDGPSLAVPSDVAAPPGRLDAVTTTDGVAPVVIVPRRSPGATDDGDDIWRR